MSVWLARSPAEAAEHTPEQRQPDAAAPLSLSYIGQQVSPTATDFQGTRVGGQSGIEHVGNGQQVAIRDGRSQVNPAGYDNLSLNLSSTSFSGVNFTGVTTLRDPAGNPHPTLSIDPESIRRLPNGNLLYTSEGDVNNGINAFVREARPDGSFVRDYAVPAAFQQAGPAGSTGVRNDLAFESLTLTDGGTTIVTATENALKQDGPAAGVGVGSASRILTIDSATGNVGAQYVYNVGPVAQAPVPVGGFVTNGLVELLDLGGGLMLAVERSFSAGASTTGNTGNSIKIYVIDTAGAADVSTPTGLAGASYTPVGKELLLDLDTLRITLDNIEGVTFGPTLDNGARSLVLVSDNKFANAQFTQFIAFQVDTVSKAGTAGLALATLAALLLPALRRRRA